MLAMSQGPGGRPSAAGTAIRKRRTKAGLSIEELTYALRDLLPPSHRVTKETIRQYEVGIIPEESINPVVLEALAQVLECPVKDLSPFAVPSIDQLKALFAPRPPRRRPRNRGMASSVRPLENPLVAAFGDRRAS
jgi:transcriptional regulator with XRE-family HTH domain